MTAREYCEIGDDHYENGDYEKALKYYGKAIEFDEKNAIYWFNKGIVYKKLNDYIAAIKCIDKAIELDRNYFDAWNSKGNVWNDMQQYISALKCFEKALKLDTNNAIPYNGIGISFYHLGEYKTAIEYFDKAIALDVNYTYPVYEKGMAHQALGEYDTAINDFKKVIKMDKNFAGAWNSLGITYVGNPKIPESESYQLAQIHFKRATILDKNLSYFLNYLKVWQNYPKHPFFLQEIFQDIPKYGSLYIKKQVASMCQYINLWQEYLEKTEKYNQISQVQKTHFQAFINYSMGHPSKTFHILKDKVIPQSSNNLQTYYYLIMSCYEFLENEEPYLEEALEIAEQYRQPLPKQKKKGIGGIFGWKEVIVPKKEEVIKRYYAALVFVLKKSDEDFNGESKKEQYKENINSALSCIEELWDRTDFLPLIYLYYQLRFEQEKAKSPDKEWSKQEERGLLYADTFPKIAQYILKKEAQSTENYASGFTHHSIDPKRADWWQPLYHYAHYREISGAINLLHSQAVSHLNRKDVVAADDAKYFWEIFTITPQNITLMSEEIRKVGLQKVGQAFLNRTEVHVKDMVGKIDKSEAELKAAIKEVVYGRGDTKEQTKQTFEHLETTLEKASDIQDALVNRIASKIEAEELGSDTETYLYLISYFLLLQELSPKESIYLQFYALYADAFRSGGISKVVQGGLKDVVKTLTGEGFDIAVDVLVASEPIIGLTKATLKPFVKGSMGELFTVFLKGVQQKTMMQYSIPQDFKDGYPIPSFKESFLKFIGEEKERLGEQFQQTYPLYGYEDWLEE